MRALLRKYGLALAFVWVYLYSFPYFAKIRHANELPRVYLTKAMVDHGTFAIDRGVKRWGKTVDVSRAHGHYYSNKAPGSSFLAVPGYFAFKTVNGWLGRGEPTLAETTWVCRVFAGIVPNLLFLILLCRFLGWFLGRYREREPSPGAEPGTAPGTDDGPDAESEGRDSRGWRSRRDDAVRMALCGYGLGSLALVYSMQYMAHQLSAVCIGGAYILGVWMVEDERGDWWMPWSVGLLAGCAPLVDYQAAFAGVPLALYLIVKLGRARRWRHLGFTVLGSLPPIALLLGYHQACFDSPFATGYDYSQTFAHFHQKGFLGITELRWEAFYGSTFEPDNGLFTFCPMLLLAGLGWYSMIRRRMYWQVGITLSVFVIYLAFISSINFWRGGWQVGPRYVTAMLPFVMVPVTVALAVMSRRRALRALALALVAAGMIVYALSAAVFPHFPEKFGNPLYEVTFRLIGDGHAPYNLGYVFGLRGLSSLLPLFAVLAGVLWWMARGPRTTIAGQEPGTVRGDDRLSAGLGLVGAGLLLGLYSLFSGGGRRAERAYEFLTTVFPT